MKCMVIIFVEDVCMYASRYGNFVGPKFFLAENFVPQFFHMFGELRVCLP